MGRINKLLIGELSFKRIVSLFATQVVGVAIIFASIQFFFDVKGAFNTSNYDKEYLIITKKVGLLNSVLSSNLGFSNSELEALRKLEGVEQVGEFVSSAFSTQASLSIPSMGVGYTTEMFFEAVDDEFIDIISPEWHYAEGDDLIPIIIPQNYVNLYNFGFAAANGLPKASKDLIKRVEVDIVIGDRLGRRAKFKGKIAGFSSRINTILAPSSFVEWANKHYSSSTKQQNPQRLILRINPSHTDSIMRSLEEQGYEPENKVFNYEKMSSTIAFVVGVVLVIGLIITLLSVFILILSVLLIIERNKTKIFNLFILGFNLRSIYKPYARMAYIMTTLAFVLALVLGFASRTLYLNIMTNQLGLMDMHTSVWQATASVVILYMLVMLMIRTVIIKQLKSIRK